MNTAITVVRSLFLCFLLLPSCDRGIPPEPPPLPRVLVFSKTVGFRHQSIPKGISAILSLASANRLEIDTTENSAAFNDANLAKYAAVVFLSTTGDVLDSTQQTAFQRFIREGGGFVGIHSAADTEYGWPWYGGLVGAYFQSHPAIQTAVIHRIDSGHPSTRGVPVVWTRTDEWYNFRSNPSASVTVLLRLDEATYSGGTMGANHPISWCRLYDGGRTWYSALGHTEESFSEPDFLRHIGGGILWAARLEGEVNLP